MRGGEWVSSLRAATTKDILSEYFLPAVEAALTDGRKEAAALTLAGYYERLYQQVNLTLKITTSDCHNSNLNPNYTSPFNTTRTPIPIPTPTPTPNRRTLLQSYFMFRSTSISPMVLSVFSRLMASMPQWLRCCASRGSFEHKRRIPEEDG